MGDQWVPVARESNHVARELELSVQGTERSWRLSWSPKANDLLNHQSCLLTRASIKTPKGRGAERIRVAELLPLLGGGSRQRGQGPEPCPRGCP